MDFMFWFRALWASLMVIGLLATAYHGIMLVTRAYQQQPKHEKRQDCPIVTISAHASSITPVFLRSIICR